MKSTTFFPVLATFFACLWAFPLQAEVYFDSNGTTAGFGNPGTGDWGTWNVGNLNWAGSGVVNYDGTGATDTYANAVAAAVNDLVVFNGGAAPDTPLVSTTVQVLDNFSDVAGIRVFGFGNTTPTTLGTLTFASGTLNRTITFASGAVVDTQSNLSLTNRVQFQGSFEKTGAGRLQFGTHSGGTALVGTITITAGTVELAATNRFGSGTNLVMNGGGFTFGGTTVTYTIGNLSGTGTIGTTSTGDGTSVRTLNIEQTSNQTYSGTITQTSRPFQINKNGSATLTLNGSTFSSSRLNVNGGVLILDTATTTVAMPATVSVANGYVAGSNSITVQSGATLAGSSSVNLVTGGVGFDVEVQSGGKLRPGGSLGNTLTFTTLATEKLDIEGAVGGLNVGALEYDLGSSVDSIVLNGGFLNIGTNLLEWNDFNFTVGAGLVEGTYKLINTSAGITGTLGSSLSGSLGNDFNGQLQLDGLGQDIELVVTAVPEPGAIGLGLVGLSVLALRRRRLQ